MKIFFLIIVCLTIVAFVISYAIYACNQPNSWSSSVRIKFSDFKKWYLIAPSGWYCYDGYVSKKGDCYDLDIYCTFSFIDFYCYVLWNMKKKAKEEEKRNNIRLARVLSLVQKDIDNYIKDIDKETEKCQKEYEEILNKVKKSL